MFYTLIKHGFLTNQSVAESYLYYNDKYMDDLRCSQKVTSVFIFLAVMFLRYSRVKNNRDLHSKMIQRRFLPV